MFQLHRSCKAWPIQIRPPFQVLQQLQSNLINYLKRTFLQSVPNMSAIGPSPVNPTWPTMAILPRGRNMMLYRCHYYSDHFKRKEHFRRHERSQRFTLFLCPYPGCGTWFDRQDVLKRHQAVHQAHPMKRRRRPRRGALPRAQLQNDEILISEVSLINEYNGGSGDPFAANEKPRNGSASSELKCNTKGSFNGVNLDTYSCFSKTFREGTYKLNVWTDGVSSTSKLFLAEDCGKLTRDPIAAESS